MHPYDAFTIGQVRSLPTFKSVDSKYHIKNKELGKGSFATTYISIDSLTDTVLACKMISKRDLLDKINLTKNKALTKDYFIHALKNQVSTWKSINHQNIVKFADFSETSNNIYFFMEFCPGGNIETMLRRHGPIPQQNALRFFQQLARGCTYLFENGIYHRDIKTQNILIGHKGQLKISDFGFAKMVAKEEQIENPKSQTSVGTPIYMSPQVILGEPYTIKCDVWSLGIVYYKILYNLYPWKKIDNLAILANQMKNTIQFPPNLNVSNHTKALIQDMLLVDEQKRISMREVYNRLTDMQIQ